MTLRQLQEAHAVNWSALARRYGYHPTLFSHVLHGRRRNRVVRSIIATTFGLRPEQIWPEEKAS